MVFTESQDGTEPSPKQEVTAAETWFHGELQWPWQRRWQKEEDTMSRDNKEHGVGLTCGSLF